jgi:hypothetical protein
LMPIPAVYFWPNERVFLPLIGPLPHRLAYAIGGR